MPDRKGAESRSRFARLSGIGLQMGITIFLGAYLGKFLDQKFPSDKRWFTIGLTLFSVAVALYNVLKQLNRINDEEKKDR
jgi:F0F1-type ATP synthase assembly protein I